MSQGAEAAGSSRANPYRGTPTSECRPPSPRSQSLLREIDQDTFSPCPAKLVDSAQHNESMGWKDYLGSWLQTLGRPVMAIWHWLCDWRRGGESAGRKELEKKVEEAKRAVSAVIQNPEELAIFEKMLTEGAQCARAAQTRRRQ